MFKNPFSFNGRIRRLEYGISLLVIFPSFGIVAIVLDIVDPNRNFSILPLSLCIPILWLFIAQRTKRCHDVSVTGWWQLIPFYGWVLLFGESDPGDNEYGPNPKGIAAYVDDWDPFKSQPIDDVDGTITTDVSQKIN